MSRPGCQQTSAKPCNRNAEESFPVLSLKSQEQKPPNPLLIQDKNALQPRPCPGERSVPLCPALAGHDGPPLRCGGPPVASGAAPGPLDTPAVGVPGPDGG